MKLAKMPPSLQAKLLHVLQDPAIFPDWAAAR